MKFLTSLDTTFCDFFVAGQRVVSVNDGAIIFEANDTETLYSCDMTHDIWAI